MTLNEAIFEVITTQYKKDAEEAHEIVKSAGYDVFKRDGAFNVTNPETHRTIAVSYGSYYWMMTLYKTCGYRSYKRDGAARVDFQGYLDKPLNSAYSELWYTEQNRSYAKEKYDKICSIKWSIKYEEKRIDKIKKQLEDLQKDLEDAYEAKAYSEMRLEKFKRECKLA